MLQRKRMMHAFHNPAWRERVWCQELEAGQWLRKNREMGRFQAMQGFSDHGMGPGAYSKKNLTVS